MDSDATPVVIDNGTGLIKAGFAGAEHPAIVMPNCVGRPARVTAVAGMHTEHKQMYIGNEAQAKRGAGLTLSYPLRHGIVDAWDDMESIWHHLLFHELRIDPAAHPMLLTEAPLNPRRNREQMASIMFEAFNVPAFFVVVQAVLSLYATGRTTGVVLDMGDGVSHVVPVYEGYALQHAVQRLNLAGRDLTEYLAQLMAQCGSGVPLTTTAEKEIARDIKERCCYVARDFDAEVRHFESERAAFAQLYTMPDGREVTVDEQAFRAPEALFRPSLLGMESDGVDALVHAAVQRCDVDLRRSLYSNVVVSGGTSTVRGLPERLRAGLQERVPPAVKVKVSAPAERKYAVFRGGAVLSNLQTFQQMWVTRDEYDEVGVNVVHRRCI